MGKSILKNMELVLQNFERFDLIYVEMEVVLSQSYYKASDAHLKDDIFVVGC